MHELILDFVRDAPAPHALARFPLDDGALVALFHNPPGAGRCRSAAAQAPRWIAKTAATHAGCRRLRAEARALGQLEPWAAALGLPRLLGWSEAPGIGHGANAGLAAGLPPSACLIQSGVPGTPARHTPSPATLGAATAWLRRFQHLVPAPRPPATLAELAERTRAQIDDDRQRRPYETLLLAALQPLIAPRHLPALAPISTVAIHGDFWAGNVLISPSQPAALHIVDWSGFDAGTALDDLLTWMSHPIAGPRAHDQVLERWIVLFFAPGPARDTLRDWAAGAGYSDAVARASFLLFLVRRLRWELGLGLQARSQTEVETAHRDWTAVLTWMAQHRYPDPFTPVPL